MTLRLIMHHRVLECFQIYSKDAPGLNLTYFMARSNLVPYAFVLEKVKTMDFAETIVVYDIKIGRCSQLKWIHEALWVPKVKVIHWPWSRSLRFNILKLLKNAQVSDTGPIVIWFIFSDTSMYQGFNKPSHWQKILFRL